METVFQKLQKIIRKQSMLCCKSTKTLLNLWKISIIILMSSWSYIILMKLMVTNQDIKKSSIDTLLKRNCILTKNQMRLKDYMVVTKIKFKQWHQLMKAQSLRWQRVTKLKFKHWNWKSLSLKQIFHTWKKKTMDIGNTKLDFKINMMIFKTNTMLKLNTTINLEVITMIWLATSLMPVKHTLIKNLILNNLKPWRKNLKKSWKDQKSREKHWNMIWNWLIIKL